MENIDETLIDVSDLRRKIPHKERSTTVSSNHVIHFTNKFENLKGIIENGFRPSECEEYPIFLQAYYEIEGLLTFLQSEVSPIENRKVPVICFCDLVKKSIKDHIKKYGYYGIGLTKSWAISNYLCPLFYIPKDTSTHSTMYGIVNLSQRILELKIHEENPEVLILIQNIYKLLDFIKPYQDPLSGEKYYDEREWRYVPNRHFDPEDPETYLKFNNEDIIVIYVKTCKEEREIHKILERAGSKFDRNKIKLARKTLYRS
jgi:hypothetical protein